jgi:hypothetical protein
VSFICLKNEQEKKEKEKKEQENQPSCLQKIACVLSRPLHRLVASPVARAPSSASGPNCT